MTSRQERFPPAFMYNENVQESEDSAKGQTVMVKRFYQGLISLRFSMPMTFLAFSIFIVAFFRTKSDKPFLTVIMGCLAAVLAVIMFFYYKAKLGVARTLHNVENIEEYERGGMLDRSFILEDRMLAGYGLKVKEIRTDHIQECRIEEKGRKALIHMTTDEGPVSANAIDLGEAQRFAAFLKRKNPDIVLNMEPAGNGTLKELGANIKV